MTRTGKNAQFEESAKKEYCGYYDNIKSNENDIIYKLFEMLKYLQRLPRYLNKKKIKKFLS